MRKVILNKSSARGRIVIPGDKSISIRSLLFASISNGTSIVKGFGSGEDVKSAVSAVKQLGIVVESLSDGSLKVFGKGLHGYKQPAKSIDCGNSGTTFRLLCGILAGQKFRCQLIGDESLSSRPMKRIIEPLTKMGANIKSNNDRAPLEIIPATLTGTTISSKVSSAQVKSAVLLAALYAEGKTRFNEPSLSRNHTELMLVAQGANIFDDGQNISVERCETLSPIEVDVPGDISSAAFFLVLGTLLENSELTLQNVGLNPTRTGITDALLQMGANLTFSNPKKECGEPVSDIIVKSSKLNSITLEGNLIPRLIDEIPIIAIAAAMADGTTSIHNAKELRVKETDRIKAMCVNLKAMGVELSEFEDGMKIIGQKKLIGAKVASFGDHRIAISFAVAGSCAIGKTLIEDAEWADISYPGFFDTLNTITQ